ncbi:FTR1 family iron permease [Pseudomonas azotoformans]|uniref:FTR1 family iron permease n=1 Tax=Pseudomonas azotoformans TaxID=47878 RepID=A0A1V2J2C4_PSEAZ|nr:FTR1 family protein [Pseudomonas azotoformans]OIN51882.1 FTR1 family iron permease [Pseudomonas azotoformans]ONH39425.1 FTR1 family iron permease [Pseudomonas azotoformans]SDN32299.1 high-affinity iron transporter [Pseudomonas azotoformans]
MNTSMFIVWRESVEALLVIGILQAWISCQAGRSRLARYLWAGVLLGLLGSAGLAVLMLWAGEAMTGPAGEWLQAALTLVASGLMVQMVFWMHRHAPTLRHRLVSEADRRLARHGSWGVLLLALLAVSREGSETVVFLYGAGARLHDEALGLFAVGGVLGLVLAGLTVVLLRSSQRFISWARFFALSEALLLLLGGALLVAAVDRISGQLLAMDMPDWVYSAFGDSRWDSSLLLSDSHGLGALLADFAGYRAAPSLITVLVLLGYWLLVGNGLRRSRQAA